MTVTVGLPAPKAAPAGQAAIATAALDATHRMHRDACVRVILPINLCLTLTRARHCIAVASHRKRTRVAILIFVASAGAAGIA